MKIKTGPIIMVRKVAEYFEYYIQQGNKKLNFFLDRSTHDELRHAQALAEQAPERRGDVRPVIVLQVADPDRKSSAG